MIRQEQIPQVLDIPVQGTGGQKLGEVKHVFLDDDTGQPEWLCVKTGLFGMNETFVPIRNADLVEDHVEVPYDKERVKGAPNVDVDAGGHLSVEQERELYRYYDMNWDTSWDQANRPGQGWAHTGGQQERERLGGLPGEPTPSGQTGRPGETGRLGETGAGRRRESLGTRLRRYLTPEQSRKERPGAKRDDFGDTGQSGRPR
ncbi:PRC-barrel domain-containing protein [Microtetraspora glauca]|uniref:PRC-barrel domain-containing protein n=1 Tax=Microtetraspora glauca TaxID=1996 RepID=A0ABV3GT30_MICGL